MLIGYARVSTLDQSTDLQTDALSKAGCKKIFQEIASGRKSDRPQLLEALNYMREEDTLVVWNLDRLARSTKQLISTVEDLNERNINFKCLTFDIDTTTASGTLVFTIFSALSQFEAELISERTKAGLDAARARGRLAGRPKVLSEDDLVRGQLLLDGGQTTRQVAEALNVSKATISRCLTCSIKEK